MITIATASVNNNKEQGWHQNTELCVDLKTVLLNDRRMKAGKNYQGVLRRDVEIGDFLYDEHFTFIETEAPKPEKRNPQVFRGEYITITRRDDGTYHPNFRPVSIGEGFKVERYVSGIANELFWALEGLVEEE